MTKAEKAALLARDWERSELTAENVELLYWGCELSQHAIAALFGVCQTDVRALMQKHNIPARHGRPRMPKREKCLKPPPPPKPIDPLSLNGNDLVKECKARKCGWYNPWVRCCDFCEYTGQRKQKDENGKCLSFAPPGKVEGLKKKLIERRQKGVYRW